MFTARDLAVGAHVVQWAEGRVGLGGVAVDGAGVVVGVSGGLGS